ncbi:hypothetical protein SALBM135S_05594 [Streptomyces alboniger]
MPNGLHDAVPSTGRSLPELHQRTSRSITPRRAQRLPNPPRHDTTCGGPTTTAPGGAPTPSSPATSAARVPPRSPTATRTAPATTPGRPPRLRQTRRRCRQRRSRSTHRRRRSRNGPDPRHRLIHPSPHNGGPPFSRTGRHCRPTSTTGRVLPQGDSSTFDCELPISPPAAQARPTSRPRARDRRQSRGSGPLRVELAEAAVPGRRATRHLAGQAPVKSTWPRGRTGTTGSAPEPENGSTCSASREGPELRRVQYA